MNHQANKESLLQMLISIPTFWRSQQKDWKVTVIRTSLERLGYQIIFPYLSLYIIALGATKSQLGIITAAGMLMSGLLGPFVGRFIDKNGAKKIYVLGIVMLLLSYLIYGFAPVWQVCVLAMVVYYFGQGISGQSCATICGNCLQTCDRARGMLVCESLAAGFLGMAGPIIAVFLLVNVIGTDRETASASDLRWLFFVSATFTLLSLLLVIFHLGNQKWAVKNLDQSALRRAAGLLKENRNARKWIIIAAINYMPNAMVLPYVQVFAEEMKGASIEVLGYMVTGSALASMIFGYPVGVLADRFGRKKVLLTTVVIFWVSNILLLLSASPAMLIVAGILQGFFHISAPLSGAIQRELVSPEVMGTWIGVTKFTNAVFSAVMAILAGWLYDYLGSQWCFLVYIALDLLIRVPLLMSLPETLKTAAE